MFSYPSRKLSPLHRAFSVLVAIQMTIPAAQAFDDIALDAEESVATADAATLESKEARIRAEEEKQKQLKIRAQAMAEIQRARAAEVAAQQRTNEAEKEMNRLKAEIAEFQKQIKLSEERRGEFEKRIETAKVRTDKTREQRDQVGEQKKQIELATQQTLEAMKQAEMEAEQLAKQSEQIANELREAKLSEQRSKVDAERVKGQKSRAEEELAKLTDERMKMQTEREAWAKEIAAMNEDNKATAAKQVEAKRNLEAEKVKFATWKKWYEGARKSMIDKKIELGKQKAQILEEVTSLQGEQMRLKKDYDQLEADYRHATTELESARNAQNRVQAEKEERRASRTRAETAAIMNGR